MNNQLYRVGFKVRPTPGHPKYWEWAFGFLGIFLHADSPEEAARRATALVDILPLDQENEGEAFRILPYERVGDEIQIETDFDTTEEVLAWQDHGPRQAGEIGLALRLHACVTGTDEGNFESRPLGDEG
jgi:hypothetical protein